MTGTDKENKMELDFSDQYIIKLTKVKIDGRFTHWEIDAGWTQLEGWVEGTAPSAVGALDLAIDYMYEGPDSNTRWAYDDANHEVNISSRQSGQK